MERPVQIIGGAEPISAKSPGKAVSIDNSGSGKPGDGRAIVQLDKPKTLPLQEGAFGELIMRHAASHQLHAARHAPRLERGKLGDRLIGIPDVDRRDHHGLPSNREPVPMIQLPHDV